MLTCDIYLYIEALILAVCIVDLKRSKNLSVNSAVSKFEHGSLISLYFNIDNCCALLEIYILNSEVIAGTEA